MEQIKGKALYALKNKKPISIRDNDNDSDSETQKSPIVKKPAVVLKKTRDSSGSDSSDSSDSDSSDNVVLKAQSLVEEKKPLLEEKKPLLVEEKKPLLVEEKKPLLVAEKKPLVEETKPLVDQKNPYDEILEKLEQQAEKNKTTTIDELNESFIKTQNIVKLPPMVEIYKQYFEKTHFKIDVPPLFCTEDPDDGVIMQKKSDFLITYENETVNVQSLVKCGKEVITITNTKNFVSDYWLKDKNIRSYKSLKFDPKRIDDKKYNLFDGFVAEKYKYSDASIKKILKHIMILVNHDIPSYEYVLSWLAHVVQKPWKKTGVCMVFKSCQGAGKNTFFDWFGNCILGKKYYTSTPSLDTLLGRFENGTLGKILINIDELSSKDAFGKASLLKNLMTQPTKAHEKKGVDPIEVDNFNNLVATTNSHTPLKVEVDDRRTVMFESSDEVLITKDINGENIKYFETLYKNLENKEVQSSFYVFLMDRDISNFNCERDRPFTSLYKDVQSATIPILVNFFEDVILLGYLDRPDKSATFLAHQLFTNYLQYLTAGNYDIKVNKTNFGRDMMRYKGISKTHTNKGNSYVIIYQELEDYLYKNKLISQKAIKEVKNTKK